METTLVLDHAYHPLSPVPWQMAMTAVVKGMAEVIVAYPDRVIRSASRSWPFPAVIRLTRAFRRRDRGIVKYSPENVYARDNWSCAYCGERFEPRDLTRDHVMPRSRGGRTNWENTISCCKPCNNRKADRTPEEAGMPLRRRPHQPRWLPPRTGRLRGIPVEWRDFVGG